MKTWKKILLGVVALGIITGLIAPLPFIIIEQQRRFIHEEVSDVEVTNVAIVFGAGLKRDGTPSDALRDRLIVAARLYEAGKVKKILVSGDNRFVTYSEPDAMRDVLVNDFKIPLEDIAVDYAGRRTYDTCVRAKELWGVDRAVLVTQDFHLPRAIWTCKQLDVESAGVSASLRPYMIAASYRLREMLAAINAFIDIYLWAPSYVGGEFVTDLDQ